MYGISGQFFKGLGNVFSSCYLLKILEENLPIFCPKYWTKRFPTFLNVSHVFPFFKKFKG